ncbi:type III secretion system outer membrane ring protein InvG [Salmonella enterica]|uniref:type III secretion system outer membrane ring protein InvG n=1 Tax=Salmonella enterica TaxID=28901 RepID=UPI001309FE5B|nr:type III secretion system outer membrane ring protein InvG [Salmonella enterica]EDT6571319.1 type III secretion system outer membrane ring protein InvG [Salmonella enterica subsp. enterica]HBL9991103.1 type III secretion system outer membrane ring protein InvG [Salmonella enterica subsp. enterica serovar Hidalgo]EBP2450303.1 type III secretion system outer membrane ring protein InvG [Salmonella enterica]EHK9165734.1 type III secretion system outer membrane ring protein InvG [Salmonella enter
MKTHILLARVLACAALVLVAPGYSSEKIPVTGSGFVAKDDSLRTFFDAMALQLKEPVIVSKMAARKKITGNFEFHDPNALLEKLSLQLGLIWYFDGQAIYIYDASEMRNAVVSLRNVSLNEFNNFLKRSGLYNKNYPLRGDNRKGTFYVSGPPVYVDMVVNAATMMDKQNDGIELGRQKIGVMRLNNTFVGDRTYNLRDQKMVIPGIATAIERLLQGEEQPLGNIVSSEPPAMPAFSANGEKGTAANYAGGMSLQEALKQNAAAGNIKIVAYPDTNSLLVKGTAEQVHFIEMLVKALDVAKRHVELSLWIVDLNKSDLERLGTSWSGSITIGDKLGVSLNQASISTLDGSRFIAAVNALEEKKQATVVSRPVLLTQENVPAIFDNNRTFYTKLIGERNVALEHVTYGTMIRVLPRFSADGQIEMSLDIEDGNDKTPQSDTTTSVDALPEVGRTLISTIARVPHGKSLLVGGYTRDANTDTVQSIPFLGKLPLIGSLFRYSSKNKSNVVRVFMIEPKEIVDPLTPDASESVNNILKQSGAWSGDDKLQKWVRVYLDRGQEAIK